MNVKRSHRTLVFTFGCLIVAGLIGGCQSMGGGAADPGVGTWDLVVESALGTSSQTLVIGADMTGSLDVEDTGMLEISNVATEGNSVTFDVTFDIQGQELAAKFEGTVDGDSISGEYVTELGNGTVTGTRSL